MKTFFKILFAPLLWLVHACSPLGEPVNEEKSDNHYYNKKKNDIRYSPMGNWFELGNSPMNADVESFEVMTRFISRDKNRAYFKEESIDASVIDLDNFYVKQGAMMTDMGFDNTHVYAFEKVYGTKQESPKITRVENANPKTYVRTQWDWANDGQNHFYRNQLISVDFDSFQNINRTFSKDRNKAYVHYNTHFEAIEGADVKNFKVLDEGNFAMDSLQVFSMVYTNAIENNTKLAIIPKHPNEEVSLLNASFLQIGKRIFFRGSFLKGLEPESLEIIGHFYIKDKNRVFYKDQLLEDADPQSFGSLGEWKIGDKKGVFKEGVREQRTGE